MKTSHGKIARLPKVIREQLNRRIENGWRGARLVNWLNELPQVKEVLLRPPTSDIRHPTFDFRLQSG